MQAGKRAPFFCATAASVCAALADGPARSSGNVLPKLGFVVLRAEAKRA